MDGDKLLWEYASFGLILLGSLFTLCWYSIRRVKTPHAFIFCPSVLQTWRASLSLVGVALTPAILLAPSFPAETWHLWVLAAAAALLATTLAFLFAAPILQYTKSASVFQYLEDRFQSKSLRRLAALWSTILVALYGVLALSTAAMLAAFFVPLPIWALCAIFGVVVCIPLVVGGFSAAVDAMGSSLVLGTLLSLGCVVGIGRERLSETVQSNFLHSTNGSLFLSTDMSALASAMTFATVFLSTLNLYGFCQLSHQHYCALGRKKRLRLSLIIILAAVLFCVALLFATLLVVDHQNGANCSVVESRYESFANSIVSVGMELYVGFGGYMLAGIIWLLPCAAAGTVFATSTVLWDELLCRRYKNAPPREQMVPLRILVTICSLALLVASVCICLFIQDLWLYLTNALITLSLLALPLTVIYFCGISLPCSNSSGAFTGFFFGTAVALWLCVGYQLNFMDAMTGQAINECLPAPDFSLRLDNDTGNSTFVPTTGFLAPNATEFVDILQKADIGEQSESLLTTLYTNRLWHHLLTAVATALCTLLISLVTGSQDLYALDWNLMLCTCTSLVERVRFDPVPVMVPHRSTRSLCVPSESFRYAQQGPLPDTSYHNPQVKLYMEKEMQQ